MDELQVNTLWWMIERMMDGQMGDRWIKKQVNGQVGKQTGTGQMSDRWEGIDEYMDVGQMNSQMDRWLAVGLLDYQNDGQMDGRTDEWVFGQTG